MSLEKKVIGTLLLTPDSYVEVCDLLTEETFAERDCAAIFKAFSILFNKGLDISIDLIQAELKKMSMPYDAYSVIDDFNSGYAFIEHCRLLKEQEIRRKQALFASKIVSMSSDPTQDPFDTNDIIVEGAEKIMSLVEFGKNKTNVELVAAVTKKIDSASSTNGITGIRTGFTELDRIYCGRQNSNLIIKAARPAMGKTAQALSEAKFMALEDNKKVAFFSLEMGAEELMQRLVSMHTSIPMTDIRKGRLSNEQWGTYHETVGELTNDNLVIIDNIYSLNEIKTRCKKMKMQGTLDVIFIDYLQLIIHKVSAGRNKENEVSEISRSLKMLAKSLNVPVICLCQLSRGVESRSDKKPLLSDLRDSGAIEQDADIVEFIYRPDYYVENGKSVSGQAFVCISKNRSGACGDVELYFHAECTKFEEKRTIYGTQNYGGNREDYNDPF